MEAVSRLTRATDESRAKPGDCVRRRDQHLPGATGAEPKQQRVVVSVQLWKSDDRHWRQLHGDGKPGAGLASTGDMTIASAIDLSGVTATSTTSNTSGGPGGEAGSPGVRTRALRRPLSTGMAVWDTPQRIKTGSGYGGGGGGVSCIAAGGGGYGGVGGWDTNGADYGTSGTNYGNNALTNLYGGSGGGSAYAAGPGGGGGGALELIANGALSLASNGTLKVNGGGAYSTGRDGGGGSGGGISWRPIT